MLVYLRKYDASEGVLEVLFTPLKVSKDLGDLAHAFQFRGFDLKAEVVKRQKVEFLAIFHVFITCSPWLLHYLLNDTLFILKVGKVEVGLQNLAKVQVRTCRQVELLMETLIEIILQLQL